MSSEIVGAGDELQSFIKLAREIFHDEPWDQVQRYVERAWHACQLSDGPSGQTCNP